MHVSVHLGRWRFPNGSQWTLLVPPFPNELGSHVVDPQHPDWSHEPREAIEHVERGSSALRWAVKGKRHPDFGDLVKKGM